MSQVTALLCRRFGFDRFRLACPVLHFGLTSVRGDQMPKQRERWIAAHQALGHDPHPAPTRENPEQWECKCDPDAVDRHLAHSHPGAGPPEVRPSREDETLAAGLHDVGENARRDHAPPGRTPSQPHPGSQDAKL